MRSSQTSPYRAKGHAAPFYAISPEGHSVPFTESGNLVPGNDVLLTLSCHLAVALSAIFQFILGGPVGTSSRVEAFGSFPRLSSGLQSAQVEAGRWIPDLGSSLQPTE